MEGSSAGLVYLLNGKAEVSLVILTNGDIGCSNIDICTNKTNAEVASIRQSEQINSAAILGIKSENIYFRNYEDCLLNTYSTIELEREILSVVRSIQPHIVLTWDPASYFEMIPSEGWGDLGYHVDHQTSGKLALDSAWISHLSRLWPELGVAWKMEELYFFAFTPSKKPDFFVDVTGEPFEKKYEAFAQMKSQYVEGEEKSTIGNFLTFVGSQVASQVGLVEGRYAEGFTQVLWPSCKIMLGVSYVSHNDEISTTFQGTFENGAYASLVFRYKSGLARFSIKAELSRVRWTIKFVFRYRKAPTESSPHKAPSLACIISKPVYFPHEKVIDRELVVSLDENVSVLDKIVTLYFSKVTQQVRLKMLNISEMELDYSKSSVLKYILRLKTQYKK